MFDGHLFSGIGAVLLIAVAFLGLGRITTRLVGRSSEHPVASVFDIVAGWGVTAQLVTIAGLLGVRVTPVLLAVFGAGVICAFLGFESPQNRRLGFRSLALAAGLCLPLLVIAATIPAVMYDEFAQWLPNARFVYDQGFFPDFTHPNLLSVRPAYPYGGPLINVLGSLLVGQWLDTPNKLFTVLLFGLFGIALARAARGSDDRPPGIASTAIGVLIVTVFNPTFDPRIVLTSYMDASSGVLAGLAGFAVWRGVSAFAEDEIRAAKNWFWRGGGVAAAMVFARDTNVVLLFGLGTGALAACAPFWRRPRLAVTALSWLIVPPLVGFLSWRLYCMLAALPQAVAIRPLDEWQWNAIIRVPAVLLTERLANHLWLGAISLFLATVSIGAGVVIVRRGRPPLRRLVIIVATTAGLWLSFLGFVYVASFGASDIQGANSAWRYISELGPLLLIAAAALLQDRLRPPPRSRAVAALVVFLTLGLQLGTIRHWRIDCGFADVVAVRRIAAAMSTDLSSADHAVVVHAAEPFWYAEAIRYQLQFEIGRLIPIAANSDADLIGLTAGRNDPVLDLRAIDRAAIGRSGIVPSVPLYRHLEAALETVARSPAMTANQSCGWLGDRALR